MGVTALAGFGCCMLLREPVSHAVRTTATAREDIVAEDLQGVMPAV
jgi:hypothetical protein